MFHTHYARRYTLLLFGALAVLPAAPSVLVAQPRDDRSDTSHVASVIASAVDSLADSVAVSPMSGPALVTSDRTDTATKPSASDESIDELRKPLARRKFFTSGDLWMAGAFALGTVVASRFDTKLAREFQEPGTQRKPIAGRTASIFSTFGDPGTLALTTATFAIGRFTNRPGLADVGLHATRAALTAGAASTALKFLSGRSRPYMVGGADHDEFRFGRGRGGQTSFPSGHTTVAFAAAAAVSAEVGRSDFAIDHPTASKLVTPLLYTGAGLVGASRIYRGAHWLSDVVAAAGLGTIVGRAVVRHQHADEDSDSPSARTGRAKARRWMPNSIAPTPGGGSIGWSIPIP